MTRRFISAVVLSTSTIVLLPTAGRAAVPPSTTTVPHRVYDPYRHDYHDWTRDEERAYRAYLAERHRAYIAYRRQQAAERRAYWHWRHEREERLEHERR